MRLILFNCPDEVDILCWNQNMEGIKILWESLDPSDILGICGNLSAFNRILFYLPTFSMTELLCIRMTKIFTFFKKCQFRAAVWKTVSMVGRIS